VSINRQSPPPYYPGVDEPFPWHPYACLLPESSETQLSDFVKSIRKSGQIDPVIVYQGQILDGRHREKAIAEINRQNQLNGEPLVSLIYGYFRGGETGPDVDYLALSLVEARNLCRVNFGLTASQRAVLARRFEEEYAAIAKAKAKSQEKREGLCKSVF
jgi:hypothetical protein